MYGKIFATMYEGSMVGAGPVVFAIWGYCIARADVDGTVLLNPQLLAPIIGTSRQEIEKALDYLKSPDEHSKNTDHEGRRIIHQAGHLYFVVSHALYRNMKNNEDRREYMREYMRKKRGSSPVNINKVNAKLTQVNPASSSSSSSSACESEGGCKGETETYQQAYTLARSLMASIASWKPDFAEIQPSKAERTATRWAKDVNIMLRVDKRKPDDVQAVIDWLPSHEGSCGFTWRAQILSGRKLREKFDKLQIAKQQSHGGYKCTI